MWIFGYGSLIWKVDFPYKRRVVGYIKGYVRRFWQASIDHRGVPDKPGRVVTLIPSDDPESRVYGVAYELADDESSVPIKNRLDEREKRYEKTADVPFYAAADDWSVALTCSVYIGRLNGPLYLGPAPAELMARQIVEAAGPSGTNLDYFTRLSDFMKNEIGCIDSHLVQLEAAVQSEKVWGVAYEIGCRDVEQVSSYLDYREKDGYQRTRVTFHPHSNDDPLLKPFALDFYLATADNPFYCGPDTSDNMARQIATSTGPSGSNKEYLYRLAESVRQLAPDAMDHHLFQLEKSVRMYDVAISH